LSAIEPDQHQVAAVCPPWYGEQDENGIDLSLTRGNLRLTPLERIRKAARRQALKLLEYGRKHRGEPNG
jgi:hypothetical protein